MKKNINLKEVVLTEDEFLRLEERLQHCEELEKAKAVIIEHATTTYAYGSAEKRTWVSYLGEDEMTATIANQRNVLIEQEMTIAELTAIRVQYDKACAKAEADSKSFWRRLLRVFFP